MTLAYSIFLMKFYLPILLFWGWVRLLIFGLSLITESILTANAFFCRPLLLN